MTMDTSTTYQAAMRCYLLGRVTVLTMMPILFHAWTIYKALLVSLVFTHENAAKRMRYLPNIHPLILFCETIAERTPVLENVLCKQMEREE